MNSEDGEAGSLLQFNPFFQRANYEASDVALRTACCENSDLCDLYYERRPSDDCTGYIPIRFGEYNYLCVRQSAYYIFVKVDLKIYVKFSRENGVYKFLKRFKL